MIKKLQKKLLASVHQNINNNDFLTLDEELKPVRVKFLTGDKALKQLNMMK